MLATLSVENFKALHDLKIGNLRKLSVFIGKNNSGKSSILQSIALLAQSVDRDIQYKGRMVDLGSFEDTVFWHDNRRQMRIEISFRIPEEERFMVMLKHGREPIILHGDIAVAFQIGAGGIFRQEVKHKGEHIHCVFERVLLDQPRRMEEKATLNGTTVARAGENVTRLLQWSLADVSDREVDLTTKVPLQEKIDITNELLRIVKSRLNTLYYFSTMRAIKDWAQQLAEVESFGTTGQNAISMLHHIYSNSPRKFSRIAKWIDKMGLGTIFSTTRGPYSSILLEDPTIGARSNVVSSGFGVNQLIPVIGECVASPPESVIMIEEPEISLHPGAIGVLVDLFLETITDKKQIMLSTHSDRLILELWSRVKLGLLHKTDVALYLVEKTAEGATVKEIELSGRREEIQGEIRVLYEPRSPLDDLLSVADKSGDKDLSKKDLSEL